MGEEEDDKYNDEPTEDFENEDAGEEERIVVVVLLRIFLLLLPPLIKYAAATVRRHCPPHLFPRLSPEDRCRHRPLHLLRKMSTTRLHDLRQGRVTPEEINNDEARGTAYNPIASRRIELN